MVLLQQNMQRKARALASLCLLLGLAACDPSGGADASMTWSEGRLVMQLQDPLMQEISGLQRGSVDGQWFALNDSGNSNELFELDGEFRVKRRFSVQGVVNFDWEDLARYSRDGRWHLLIADTGDNLQARRSVRLISVPMPDANTADGAALPVDWIVDFTYPGRALDCEAVAVDDRNKQVFFFSKRLAQPIVHVLDLPKQAGRGQRTATFFAPLKGIEAPTEKEKTIDPMLGKFRAQITGADLSPDGKVLAIQTYRGTYVLTRRENESWRAAFKRPMQLLKSPLLPQAEALSFEANGKVLYVTSERVPSGIIRFEKK